MSTAKPETSTTVQAANKAVAARFVEAFNTDDWDTVREVVAEGFTFHHPVGGTVEAGPEGMAATWAGFKALSPDSWHPIPVLIAEGDYVANLLPTYGHFTGQGEHAPPPTGGRLDYGMVNIVRCQAGQLVEMWFGMDSLVEMQQMGVAPPAPTPELTPVARANLERFEATLGADHGYDNIAAFDDAVAAIGPSQAEPETTRRRIEIYHLDSGEPVEVYRHQLTTNPPYGGNPTIDTETSRTLVERFITEILNNHDKALVATMVTEHALIHPTAMPCEASYYGPAGVGQWLDAQWSAFGDLTVTDHANVASGDIVAVRWTAQGTSHGHFNGLPPTGGPVEFTGVSMYRVEEGRIAEIWDTRNTLGILHQLNPDIGGPGHHH